MSSLVSVASEREARASTGIGLLDEKMNGGFPRRSTLLLFSEIPAEKRVFAEHLVMAGLKNNERCLYVDFYRAPQLARREFTKFGPFPTENLTLVDATSSQLLLSSSEKYSIDDVTNLEEIIAKIVAAVKETLPQRIVVDSIEFLADRFSQKEILDFWKRLDAEAKSIDSTLCFLFIDWSHETSEMSEMLHMVDYIIEFQSTIAGGVIRSMMRIEEMKDGGLKTNWVPYTFRDLTGVTVYFPRILVTGPFNAGKSTVVKNLCNQSVSIDRMGTTVAFDYGNVGMMGLEAEVFGTPGQERFEFIFKIFAREVNGILLVVDASRPADFERAKKMLQLVGPNLPFVVLANKSDLPGALSSDDVRRQIGLVPNVEIISTVATKGSGLREAMKSLAEEIIGVK